MKNNNEPSPLILGQSYLRIRNYDKALEYLGDAVMQGKGNAAKDLYHLGDYFYNQKEYAKAERAFQILADRGHGESCLRLGEMCEKGEGRRRDIEAAFGYYGESFQQGIPLGAYKAGMLMRSDALELNEVKEIALTWLEEAMNGGIYEACAAIGDLYSSHFAPGSTPRDDRVAFSWYLKGVMHQDRTAMERAATSMLEGYGTRKDTKRALLLYEEAAAQGSTQACLKLGYMYENGVGVYKEIRKALDWYMKACELEKHGNLSVAAAPFLIAMSRFFTDPMDRELMELFEGYLRILREWKYGPAFAMSAELSERAGNYNLYEAYLQEGMENGDEACRKLWIKYYMNQVLDHVHILQQIMQEFPEKKKQKKFYDSYVQILKETEVCCKKAGEAGSSDAWEILAYLYLYHGKILSAEGRDFLKAAKNVRVGHLFDMDYFMWLYYHGAESPLEDGLHAENPKKAFTMARKLAKKRKEEFYKILAEYYCTGYGVKENQKMAEEWLSKC